MAGWRRRALPIALVLIGACADRSVDGLNQLVAQTERAVMNGEFDRALALAREGTDLSADDAGWADRFRLLEAEVLVQTRQTDAATALLAAPAAPGPAADATNARRAFLAAQLETRRLRADGRLADAAPLLDAVATRATAAGAIATALDAGLLRAQVLALTGDGPAAEQLLHDVRARAAAAGDEHREAAALNNLGMSRVTAERHDEALEYFEPILEMHALADTGLYAGALNNAGMSLAWIGDFTRAVALQERAVAADDNPVYQNRALGELGNTFILSGNPAGAVPYLQRALSVATTANLPRDAAPWAGNLAVASIVLRRWDDAERYNNEAIRLSRAVNAETIVYAQNAARISAGRGQLADARTAFENVLATPGLQPSVEWEAHAGLASVLFAAGERAAAIRQFDRALGVIERTGAALLKTEQRFFFPSRVRHFYDEYVEALVTAGMDEAALEVADASRAQVLAERQGVAANTRQHAATFRALAKQGGATLLTYWLGPERSMAWVVSADRVRRVDLPPEARITRLATQYRTEVEQSLSNPLTAATTAGDALSAAVIAPVAPYLPADARVVIVADGALHGINFEMLPVGTPRRYWIQDVTIEVAPSLGLMAHLRQGSGGQARLRQGSGGQAGPRQGDGGQADGGLDHRSLGEGGQVLLVGDPTPPSPDLAPLAHAAAEIDAIAAAMAPRAVTMQRGPAATPAAYRASQPARFALIHFAAHATVSATSPLDSSIELSPAGGAFKLYARDVAAMPLEADLVTISACRSAAARAYASEGLVGFAWAFLRAGARRVVAGLWDVDDRSTATLMTAFYRRLAAGDSPGVALRSAKLDAIGRGGNFAKPYYWAPFQTFTAVPPTAGRSPR